MFSILRPYIFSLDPEVAHDLAIKSLKANILPKSFFNVENEEILETSLLGKTISNPVGLAAGFDKSAEVYNSLFKFGFGFIEVGTVTPKQQLGNPKPRIFRLEKDQALINRLGFNNHGSETVSKRISNNQPDGFLGINIGPNKETKNKEDDYYICLSRLGIYAGYITINISSPNTEGLRDFHDQGEMKKLLSGINKIVKEKKIDCPIMIKISPDISDNEISKIVELVGRHKIQGIIVSNTTDSNRDNLSDIKKHETGGLSGQPLKDISTSLIKKFYKETKGKIKIIGVGGVDSGESAFEKITAGADAVQLYTGMVYKGPGIVKEISTSLIKKFYKETKGKIKIVGVGGVDSGESAFEKITAGADAVQLYTGMVYKGPGIVKEIKKDLISILKKENLKNVSEAVGINAWPQCLQELYNTRKKLCLKDAN